MSRCFITFFSLHLLASILSWLLRLCGARAFIMIAADSRIIIGENIELTSGFKRFYRTSMEQRHYIFQVTKQLQAGSSVQMVGSQKWDL